MLDMNLSSEYTEDIRFLPGRNPHKRGEFFMQKLSGRKLLLIGFTLFSMFFGAGNLIFPPDLGAKAGIHFWPAFLGLAISAVGLPVAGVVAVAPGPQGRREKIWQARGTPRCLPRSL